MKEAVIFGAGNIGRGFIGQLFSESGYNVVFVDIDRPLLDALNGRGAYTIRLVTNETAEEVTVGPVRGIHAGDQEAVAEAVARAQIAAT
ncbi:MAG: mannitol-1-phosphate 5-dehydrogenase, partial [Anaerolineae bacterium]